MLRPRMTWDRYLSQNLAWKHSEMVSIAFTYAEQYFEGDA